jgi:hypothetical protein
MKALKVYKANEITFKKVNFVKGKKPFELNE